MKQLIPAIMIHLPIPVAARSKTLVCGRCLPGSADSNASGGWLSVVSVVCCQIEVSGWGSALAWWSPTEFGVSEYNREALAMRRP